MYLQHWKCTHSTLQGSGKICLVLLMGKQRQNGHMREGLLGALRICAQSCDKESLKWPTKGFHLIVDIFLSKAERESSTFCSSLDKEKKQSETQEVWIPLCSDCISCSNRMSCLSCRLPLSASLCCHSCKSATAPYIAVFLYGVELLMG